MEVEKEEEEKLGEKLYQIWLFGRDKKIENKRSLEEKIYLWDSFNFNPSPYGEIGEEKKKKKREF